MSKHTPYQTIRKNWNDIFLLYIKSQFRVTFNKFTSCLFFIYDFFTTNSNAVGRNYFLASTLWQTPLPFWLFLRTIVNKINFRKLRHRKKLFKNFRKLISQERYFTLSKCTKFKKSLGTSKFWIIMVASFKISNSDSVGVNYFERFFSS